MTPTAMGPGAEFDLIRRLAGALDRPDGVRIGSGDDAAWLDGDWVVSTDLTVEGVHFRRAWGEPEAWGGRAVRAALSDLAAMAAAPVAVLVSLAGSDDDHASGVLEAVGMGARAAAVHFGAPPIGGDLTRSPGPLVIDVVALGRTPTPLRRDAATPGLDLWVTGPLGGAAAAVRALLAGADLAPSLRERYFRPRPRLAEAAGLVRTGHLRAGLDLSDGVAGDASHLAAASGVGLEIDAAAVPLHPAARAAVGDDEALHLALHGGEDYELLFAAAPDFRAVAPAVQAEFADLALTRIGRTVAGEGVRLRTADGAWHPVARGFDHFAPRADDPR